MVEDAISFWTEIQRYEDMLAADPRSFCFVALSELYRKLRLLDDAISVAAKGCKQHPDYPPGFFALGAAYFAKGEQGEATKALEQAVKLKPDHVEALKLLGQLYVEDGQLGLAERVLRQVLQQVPDDTETTLLLHSISTSHSVVEPEEELPEEEEVLEELDVIEELEPIEEPQPAMAAGALPTEPPSRPASFGAAPQGAEQEKELDVEAFDESADFWGIGVPEEAEAPAEQAAAPAKEAAAPARESAAPANKSAAPEEPALFEEEESFLAFEDVEEEAPGAGAPPAAAEPARQPEGKNPLSTATLAELYVSQGYLEKAVGIYQELLSADPGNQAYRRRMQELQEPPAEELPEVSAPQREPDVDEMLELSPIEPEQPAEQELELSVPEPEEGSAPGTLEAELLHWLENIRRRRDGV